jgi:DNA-binding beta-propeller fold protein YncE
MSPGVAAGNAEDTRCDIYAFGALLYEMLTGEPPYKGRTTKEIREQILARPPRPILDLNPKADRSLAMIAEGAMGRELRDRYADVSDILADLQRVKASKGALGPRVAVREMRGRRLIWVLAGLVAIGMASWVARRATQKSLPGKGVTMPAAPVLRAEAFETPWGIAVGGGGNIYVADSEKGTVSKISGAGQVMTLAGQAGYLGLTNGVGSNAAFVIPRGIALDGAGNLYVTDAYTIRKVTPDAVVTTLVGQKGNPGTVDGVGTNAQFSWASAVAIDAAGIIYLADRYTIRKITPAGVVTTLAGSSGHAGSNDGPGGSARFSDRDKGIAVDRAGNVYVADTFNHMIRKITPAGAVTTLAGSIHEGSADGPGTNAGFAAPCGLAIDASGFLYVADCFNHTLRRITPAGAVGTVAGRAGTAGNTDGPASRSLFNQPRGVAVDSLGNIYVADTGNRSIRKITRAGVVSTISSWAPSPLAARGELP